MSESVLVADEKKKTTLINAQQCYEIRKKK